jgi:disulfide bond formation protein DsbB|tara:strand:+ start:14891 stop:15337 length:447 start_codon:yes stop_codon:yes gene_type:complete
MKIENVKYFDRLYLSLSALGLLTLALGFEYIGGYKGCFLCWAQRFILLMLAVSFLLPGFGANWFSRALIGLGLSLATFQTYLILKGYLADSCVAWGHSLPLTIFTWMQSFPACDASSLFGLPWVVWLLGYYFFITGVLMWEHINERKL